MSLPIVDISYFIENYGDQPSITREFINDEEIKKIGTALYNAFIEWGFLYLQGHGVSDDFVTKVFNVSEDFFKQPLEKKTDAVLNTEDVANNFGYVPYKYETFDFKKPHDLKEAFDYLPWINDHPMFAKLPVEFGKTMNELNSTCSHLTRSLLRLLNLLLEVDDESFLENAHQYIGVKGKNTSILRTLYYPGVGKENVEESQLRCGEHSDYGTVTLLFQDDIGGLEVQSPSGEFIAVQPVQGSIVVNAGDLLERWTSGKIKSTRHRVVLPQNTHKPRQSIAYFCQPDNDVVVSCLDGSNKYESVTSFGYLESELLKTYKRD